MVIYNGKRLIPAPFVNIRKDYTKTNDGENVGSKFNISIIGTIVAWKGSPNSSGTFWTLGDYPPDEVIQQDSRLKAIIRKQEAIRQLFATEGLLLEFQSDDGSAPMMCNPRILDIQFQDGPWHTVCSYTITMEADIVYINGQEVGEDSFTDKLLDASESWSLETSEDEPEDESHPRTYRFTHTLSAVGKRFYDSAGNLVKEPWEHAKAWVLPRLGLDSSVAASTNINNLSGYTGYNIVRNEQTDEKAGSYQVTESWVLSTNPALETFTVSVKTGLDSGISTVTIDGEIKGLESRNSSMDITSSKYTNANSRFSTVAGQLLTRAQTYSGITLNATPISTSVGRNPNQGLISYSYEYNTRPSNLISGAKFETISVVDSWGIDVFASVPILGRTKGPILQSIGTHKERTRNVTIEAIFTASTGSSATDRFVTGHPLHNAATLASIQAIVNALNPSTLGGTDVYVSDQNANFDGQKLSVVVGWTFETNDPDSIL